MILVTLDLDWSRLDNGVLDSSEHKLEAVLDHVNNCEKCLSYEYRRSASGNGYHVRMSCSGCDLCRWLFDQPIRCDIDHTRAGHMRNVLWDRKNYFKLGRSVEMEAGEWVSEGSPARPVSRGR